VTSEELAAAGLSPNKEEFHNAGNREDEKLHLKISLVPKKILVTLMLILVILLYCREYETVSSGIRVWRVEGHS
jgi:hypothetical protein